MTPGFTLWGRARSGGPWREYETWPDADHAHREVEGLRRARPDRLYVICLEGDPAPEAVTVVAERP